MTDKPFNVDTKDGPKPFHFEEGYYLIHLAGCSYSAIFWCDGNDLYAPGMEEPVDPCVIHFISSTPIDLKDIKVDTMLMPVD